MESKSDKIGIITFHASYNCGSMLQAYAMQCFLRKNGYDSEIIDFSCAGQKRLYSLYSKNNSIKNILRNSVFLIHRKRILNNYDRYEKFKREQFKLTSYSTEKSHEIIDCYKAVIAGADQIWNITIADYDDAYFLSWVKNAKRIAYAPSFGAKDPALYTENINKYKKYLNDFDYLSIRENNGQKWLYDLIGKEVPVVLDPTLIIEKKDYDKIISDELSLPEKYIFYYSPNFSLNINKLVNKISQKYNLPVIAFNAKSFYLRGMNFTKFKLPDAEDPTIYLQLMKNAAIVITTSFHGSIFSTIFKKNFWVIKNGNMFGSDDRVLTLVKQLDIEDRLIPIEFDDDFNYMQNINYENYEANLRELKESSQEYLLAALEGKK